jgi:predicted TIM-barrel fold metal-dependent hydrolase
MVAIDVHAHLSTAPYMYEKRYGKEVADALKVYYRVKEVIRTEEEMAKEFVDLGIKALIVGWDSETVTGLPPVSNDYVAKVAKDYPEAFLGAWAMIDPWKGKAAIKELERCIKDLGMFGLKFQPVAQAFFPNDKRFYPLYEKCVELKIPVSFHTGTTGLGAGLPGGAGYRLKYTRPIYLDDVAADFPELTIIAIHPSWPWQDEMIAILVHKANVYNDLSGWAPKYFSDSLKREINGRLQDKFLFGSDYPEIPPKRWLDEFRSGGYKQEVVEKVLYKNAQRIFGFNI